MPVYWVFVLYMECIETDQLTSNRHICHLFSPFSNLNTTTICSRDLARNYFSITVNCGQACRNENVIKFIFQTFLLLSVPRNLLNLLMGIVLCLCAHQIWYGLENVCGILFLLSRSNESENFTRWIMNQDHSINHVYLIWRQKPTPCFQKSG